MVEPLRNRLHGHVYHDIKWLIVGICGLSILGWLINTHDPDSFVSLGVFFLILFITISSIAYFVTNIVRRSFLIGGGVFGLFFLRLLELRQPYYIILLIACIISLELYFQKR